MSTLTPLSWLVALSTALVVTPTVAARARTADTAAASPIAITACKRVAPTQPGADFSLQGGLKKASYGVSIGFVVNGQLQVNASELVSYPKDRTGFTIAVDGGFPTTGKLTCVAMFLDRYPKGAGAPTRIWKNATYGDQQPVIETG